MAEDRPEHDRSSGDAPLRLAYQSFGQLQGMEAYQARLEATVRASAPDADVTILRLGSTIVSGKGFASAQALDVPLVLRSIAAAVDAGAEAVAIGNGFDPGLWEARELFGVPILGLFETVALHALRVGWRVGVLCSGNSGVTRIEELAARYGIATRFVRPQALGITVPDVIAGLEDAERMSRTAAAAEGAVLALAERGAEVAIVASGALDILLASSPRLTFAIPVLPSVPILVAELATAAELARRGIPFVSRAGRFATPPEEIQRATRDGGS
jgi:Asp/Glu/hydantoin racemase